ENWTRVSVQGSVRLQTLAEVTAAELDRATAATTLLGQYSHSVNKTLDRSEQYSTRRDAIRAIASLVVVVLLAGVAIHLVSVYLHYPHTSAIGTPNTSNLQDLRVETVSPTGHTESIVHVNATCSYAIARPPVGIQYADIRGYAELQSDNEPSDLVLLASLYDATDLRIGFAAVSINSPRRGERVAFHERPIVSGEPSYIVLRPGGTIITSRGTTSSFSHSLVRLPCERVASTNAPFSASSGPELVPTVEGQCTYSPIT